MKDKEEKEKEAKKKTPDPPEKTPEQLIAELEKKKDDCLFLIKVAEQAENFDDVCFYIQELIKYKLELGDTDFTFEEQNVIGVGLRNYVGLL